MINRFHVRRQRNHRLSARVLRQKAPMFPAVCRESEPVRFREFMEDREPEEREGPAFGMRCPA